MRLPVRDERGEHDDLVVGHRLLGLRSRGSLRGTAMRVAGRELIELGASHRSSAAGDSRSPRRGARGVVVSAIDRAERRCETRGSPARRAA